MEQKASPVTGPPQTPERQQRLQSERRKLTDYTGLSYAIYELGEGHQEIVYRAHVMDIATRRLVPHNLGSGEPACTHRGCHLMILNSLAADYAHDAGWVADDMAERGVQLLLGSGTSADWARALGDDGELDPDVTQPIPFPPPGSPTGNGNGPQEPPRKE